MQYVLVPLGMSAPAVIGPFTSKHEARQHAKDVLHNGQSGIDYAPVAILSPQEGVTQ